MLEHYKLLGISPAATSAEIRRAFRILARRYHPDVNPGKGSSDKFRQISEAYHVLSDPEARKQYDQERSVHETFSSAFDRAHQAYRKQQSAAKTTPEPRANQQAKTKDRNDFQLLFERLHQNTKLTNKTKKLEKILTRTKGIR
jgi:curved DNA-binding protein CbpA